MKSAATISLTTEGKMTTGSDVHDRVTQTNWRANPTTGEMLLIGQDGSIKDRRPMSIGERQEYRATGRPFDRVPAGEQPKAAIPEASPAAPEPAPMSIADRREAVRKLLAED